VFRFGFICSCWRSPSGCSSGFSPGRRHERHAALDNSQTAWDWRSRRFGKALFADRQRARWCAAGWRLRWPRGGFADSLGGRAFAGGNYIVPDFSSSSFFPWGAVPGVRHECGEHHPHHSRGRHGRACDGGAGGRESWFGCPNRASLPYSI